MPEPFFERAHDALRAGDLAGAERLFLLAAEAEPFRADAWLGLGIVRYRRGGMIEATEALARSISLDPKNPDAHQTLGDISWNLGRLDESRASYEAADRLRPGDARTLGNLGLVLAELGRFDEAIACYARSLAIDPNSHETHRNRSLVTLLRGDYPRGLLEYEWRFGCIGLPKRPLPRPVWDGSPLNGRTIMIHSEQGLGDTLQFCRYVPMVKARGGRVVFIVQPALKGLLSGLRGVDALLVQGDPIPPFDVHSALLSLPRIFGTTVETIPNAVPYISPDPALVARWKEEMAGIEGFKIGVAWQGNPNYRKDRIRSFPLSQLAPIAALPGVRLVSLQKGAGREQIAALEGRFPVIDLADRLDEATGPFLDTAALLRSLDLVIAPDTVLAHLAGALGVPCWVALPTVPHWPWLLGREDSPWYPSARVFRQDVLGDWGGVFEWMTNALSRRLDRGPRLDRPITVEIAPGELFDKITILEIKSERVADPAKLRNIRRELDDLIGARDGCLSGIDDLSALVAELKVVNEAIWDVEDELRLREAQRDFGPEFVELARSVYRNNDRRAALKRQINDRLGSRLIEEKAYTAHDGPDALRRTL